MTSAEVIRELRHLLVQVLRDADSNIDVRHIMLDIREVAEYGTDPIIELRLRHWKRLLT
jgi:hypothetical protein